MNAKAKIGLIIVAIVLICAGGIYKFFAGTYNTIVAYEEEIDSSWAQVQNQYQRRFDLIPNLVNTVKGYALHESDVFTKVTEARSKAGGVINVDSSILSDPKQFEEFQKIQNELGSSLQRLLAVQENYPELKSNQNFLALQDELEGTENRIATGRKRFNDCVKRYNSYIRSFPKSIIANMNGFEKRSYFSAGTDAQNSPKVEF